MKKDLEKRKMIYFTLICLIIIIVTITGTYAYFTAKKTVEDALIGDTATVSFGLAVEKISNVDLINGLIPMDDEMAPAAAENMCEDDFGNAVCQIYKITINNTGNTNMYLDGYITLDMVTDDEMRFVRVYKSELEQPVTSEPEIIESETSITEESEIEPTEPEEPKKERFCISENCQDETDISNIKTGIALNTNGNYNRTDDINALFAQGEKENPEDLILAGTTKSYYAMVWIHNENEAQNELQGVQGAFSGSVTFISAQGNEVTAVF